MRNVKHRFSLILSFIIFVVSAGLILPAKQVYADGIAQEEFMNDNSLVSLSIPYGNTYIGKRAYYGCKNLESVTIPYGVTKIGESAFAMCPKLAYVLIPETVKTIGPGAFAGDTALENISFEGSNNNFFYSAGVLYDDETKELISYMPGNERKVYHMPDTVRKIDKYAFWGAENLEKVVVSTGPTTITPYDFAYCSGLKYIYMPEYIKSVQEYAFRDCKNLEYLYFGNKKVSIDPTAFFNCGGTFQTVSGASADMFNEKFVYESELVEEQERLSSGSKASDPVSGNSVSGDSASGNSAPESNPAPSTAGKWDPDSTTYVTRNPALKSMVDSLTDRLSQTAGVLPQQTGQAVPPFGRVLGTYTPVIKLP